ncbi:MAG: hypothetical protein H3Z54_10290 [archaeon]|nr:hypothetical protein [archaeon]
MSKVIRYNILKDGDNTLKGKIAEEVFKRVANKLLLQDILFCGTSDLAWLLNYDSNLLKEVNLQFEDILTKLKDGGCLVSLAYDKIKAEIENSINQLGLEKVVLALKYKKCFIGGEEGEEVLTEVLTDYGYPYYRVWLCERCFNGCLKLGLIIYKTVVYFDHSSLSRIERKEPYLAGDFSKLIRRYYVINKLLGYRDVFMVLSKLGYEERNFLDRVYARERSSHGQIPFDYIGVDSKNGKYLIDVTSTTSKSWGRLSKRELEVAQEAKKRGFKILMPLVRYNTNWDVIIEFIPY